MNDILRVFIGVDKRQPVAYHVLSHSIMRRASVPVAITPLIYDSLPVQRTGLTEFTYTRYLVPWLCNYEGRALFMDADMLARCDIKDLFQAAPSHGVCVAPVSRRFERVSLMFFNNASCKRLTPDFIETETPQEIESWADSVGSLPPEYNFTIPYDGQNSNAKIVHFTQGIPCFPETKDSDFSDEWNREFRHMISSCSWEDLMGKSVHKREMA